MPIKKTVKSVTTHVRRFRGRYAALATVTVCYAVSRHAVNEWNTFLIDRNLVDEFYLGGEE